MKPTPKDLAFMRELEDAGYCRTCGAIHEDVPREEVSDFCFWCDEYDVTALDVWLELKRESGTDVPGSARSDNQDVALKLAELNAEHDGEDVPDRL